MSYFIAVPSKFFLPQPLIFNFCAFSGPLQPDVVGRGGGIERSSIWSIFMGTLNWGRHIPKDILLQQKLICLLDKNSFSKHPPGVICQNYQRTWRDLTSTSGKKCIRNKFIIMQVTLRVGNLLEIYCKSIAAAAKMGKSQQVRLSIYLSLLSILILLYYVIKQCIQDWKDFL